MLATDLKGPALREGVDLLIGVDGHPMLHDSVQGRYVRLTALGARIVRLLDGSRSEEELIGLLTAVAPQNETRIRHSLERFLGELAGSGVLLSVRSTATASPRGVLERTLSIRAPRLTLLRNLDELARHLAAPLRRLPAAARTPLLLSVIALAIVAIVMALSTPGILRDISTVDALLVVALVGVHIILHEMTHLAACGSVGAPVREGGVMLWLGVIPMVYIDHTDSYRLVPRSARVRIALAGPVFDAIAAGLTGLLALFGPASWVPGARLLLFIQLTMLAFNCNPLLPTDAYHALSAATGEISLRQRALHLIVLLISARTPLPTHLESLSVNRQAMYIGYGVLSGAYMTGMLCLLTRGLWSFLIH